jgi:hypothetical protein
MIRLARAPGPTAPGPKDLLWAHLAIHIHGGKGDRDRTTLLPAQLSRELEEQVVAVASLHAKRLARGQGYAPMPDALAREFANASRSLSWQYLFRSNNHDLHACWCRSWPCPQPSRPDQRVNG